MSTFEFPVSRINLNFVSTNAMFITVKYFVVILVFLHLARCAPVERSVGPPPAEVLDFMKQYGYLKMDKVTSAALYTEKGLSEALKDVQKFGAINQTGVLDSATLKLMSSPRCGNPDVIQGKRSKRFTFGSEGWNKRNITYYVANWSSRLGEEKVTRLVGKALKTWGDYGGLRFSKKASSDADIIVSFASGYHNDQYPFDGRGYVLAHAYFPNDGSDLSGDIHFDDDEEWVESTSQEILETGTDFYAVALHELGHSLGLGHSADPSAVMFPYYRGDDDSSLRLGQDDILAMYQLYIVRPIQETTQISSSYPRRRRPWNTRPTTKQPERNTPTIYTTHTPTRSTNSESTTNESRSRTWSSRAPTETSTRFYPTRPWHNRPSETDETKAATHNIPTSESTITTSQSTAVDRTFSTRRVFTYTDSDKYPSPTGDFDWYATSTPTYPNTKEYPYTQHNYPYSTSTVHYTSMKEYGDPKITVTVNKKPQIPSRSPGGTRAPTPMPICDICEGNFDSVSNLRGELFVFKNQYIWRFRNKNSIMPGYPILLHQMFLRLPEDIVKIDAAYQRPDSNMVLFSGDSYWVYDGNVFIENSPRLISDYGVPLGIGGVDAVQSWERNGKTYVYKGDRFWRYNENNKTVEPGYPALIDRWRGVPKDLDAAFTWTDKQTYFIKGDQYWKLDNKHVRVSDDSPRSFTKEWLGCS